MNVNGTIDIFRRGIVTAVNSDKTGTIRQLTPEGALLITDTVFKFCDVRFIDADPTQRDLSFGQRYQAQGDTLVTLREPVVGDIVMYTDRWTDGVLSATSWTHETTYKEAEGKLPRCTIKDCTNAPRLRKRCCTFHAPHEDDTPDYDDDDVTPTEVLSRAHRVISDPEQAREAATTCPGDFI